MTPNLNRVVPFVWLAAAVALPGSEASAQGITVDGRLSPAQTLAGPNHAIGAGLGRQVGSNLFHSFGAFGLKGGETATFSGPASVGNVIGRVTGGAASSINGGINSTIPGANLYLINPAGVMFGPNASVDVGGSFHASSADYLRMKDGARFGAANPDASTLSAAPPEAFGFLSAAPRPVAVNGSNLQLKQGSTSQGSTLGLVGGDVTISGGVLLAPGGTVHVASAAGPGEVPVDPRAGPPSTAARAGRVQVADSTLYPSGGSVFIRAGELVVSNSKIVTDDKIPNQAPGRNGVLSLYADRAVTIGNRANVVASATTSGRGPGVSISTAAGGTVTVASVATVATNAGASGDGGPVAISTGTLTLQNGAVVVSNATDRGTGGPISVAADSVLLDGLGTRIESQTSGVGLADANGAPAPAGIGGTISLAGGTLSVQNQALIEANTFGNGTAGSVGIAMAGNVAVTDGAQVMSNSNTGGLAGAAKDGDAGTVTVHAGVLTLVRGGTINSDTSGSGHGGEIALAVGGALTIDGANRGGFRNGVSSEAAVNQPGVVNVSGPAGPVQVSAGSVSVLNGGFINSNTRGTGRGGPVTVTTPGALLLDGGGDGSTEIGASALGLRSGDAGTVTVHAGTATIQNGAQIASFTNDVGRGGSITVNTGALALVRGGAINSNTYGPGNGGEIALKVGGALTIDGANKGNFNNGVSSEAAVGVSGSAGSVRVTAGSVSVLNGGFINSNTRGAGQGGDVTVDSGAVTVVHGGTITSTTSGPGNAGEVAVNAGGALLLDDQGAGNTGIAALTAGPRSGNAGTVTITAGTVAVQGGAVIASSTAGLGRGGGVTVTTGALAILSAGNIASSTSGSGNAGEVTLNVAGPLTIDGTGGGSSGTGVNSEAVRGSSGSAGTIQASAGSISVLNSGLISSSTRGTGAGGSVLVRTPGALLLDGQGSDASNGITAGATRPQSGAAGAVTVSAGTVTIQGGMQIATSTASPGQGGGVTVTAGALAMSGTGNIASSTSGSGNAGEVTLNVAGPLTIDGTGGGNVPTGVNSEAARGSSGSAGTIRASAGSVSVLNGGLISSSTRGTGPGGSVLVRTPGALLLDGQGVNDATGIAASAIGPQSGAAGPVTVSAGTVTVQGGAQVASSTDGPGRGGDVSVTAGSGMRLNGPGPQITATATGPGAAGSITLSAPQVFLRDGASISTAAKSANGGNITVGPGDLLYLRQSSITTSVSGVSGNGGNITTEPRLVVLDRSAIQANAVGGNGGNVQVQANQLVQSFDSAITASSQRGVSGAILVSAQPLNLNGSLVVLASELRAAAALLREGCAVRGAAPRSSLVTAGRGGQRQGLEATLPALYFAHRPVRDGAAPAAGTAPAADPPAAPQRISLSLSSACG